ncbi:Hypothetical predicted protein [Xyrichtys novacula]|uniref:Uncharacterized protein n=1 Tax=Xyrichtys novacula TaxID=13765 RepID=A0AAV1EXN0_XYRNO|nr:Hypothetical predicted protein [Xyrichtys novacula]
MTMASPVRLPAGASDNADVRELRLRCQVLSYAIQDQTLDRGALFQESMACHTYVINTTTRMARQMKAATVRSECLQRELNSYKEQVSRLKQDNLTLTKQLEAAQLSLENLYGPDNLFDTVDKAGELASNQSELESVPPEKAAASPSTAAGEGVAVAVEVMEEGGNIQNASDLGVVED